MTYIRGFFLNGSVYSSFKLSHNGNHEILIELGQKPCNVWNSVKKGVGHYVLNLINIKLKKNKEKVPSPHPKLSASDRNFQHWYHVYIAKQTWHWLYDTGCCLAGGWILTTCTIKMLEKRYNMSTLLSQPAPEVVWLSSGQPPLRYWQWQQSTIKPLI